jgi:four helix bundle protein
VGKIKSFEDLKVWQLVREFAKNIYEMSDKGDFVKDFSHKDQISRSAGSIMDNIAEGFERGGKKELIQFLFISKGSGGEARSQLYRALDKKYINQQELELLKDKALTISKQLSGFINYLKTSDLKGSKYVHEPEESYNIIEDSNF